MKETNKTHAALINRSYFENQVSFHAFIEQKHYDARSDEITIVTNDVYQSMSQKKKLYHRGQLTKLTSNQKYNLRRKNIN